MYTNDGAASSAALGAELLQHAAGAAAIGDHAVWVRGADAVYPHAVQSHRRRIEPRGACRQIVHAALVASPYRGGIEEHQVRPCPGSDRDDDAYRQRRGAASTSRRA